MKISTLELGYDSQYRYVTCPLVELVIDNCTLTVETLNVYSYGAIFLKNGAELQYFQASRIVTSFS